MNFQTVDLDVAGSNPVTHPNIFKHFRWILLRSLFRWLRLGCGLSRTCCRLPQAVNVRDIGAGNQVAVYVHRDLDARMPHLITHVGERGTGLDQHAAKRVPKVVKPNPPKAGALEQRDEMPLHEVAPDIQNCTGLGPKNRVIGDSHLPASKGFE